MVNRTEIEPIALFDLDGTLFDYDKALLNSLKSIKSPEENKSFDIHDSNLPDYLKKRIDMIRSSSSWWENLEKFKLGWDILEVAKSLGYRIMILTQGPKKFPLSWMAKKKIVDKYLGPETDITITRDKGLVYGKILVDDYPGYIQRWLDWRDRGLVIMPANEQNKNYSHPRVIRYDGSNLELVKKAIKAVKERKRGENIDFSKLTNH